MRRGLKVMSRFDFLIKDKYMEYFYAESVLAESLAQAKLYDYSSFQCKITLDLALDYLKREHGVGIEELLTKHFDDYRTQKLLQEGEKNGYLVVVYQGQRVLSFKTVVVTHSLNCVDTYEQEQRAEIAINYLADFLKWLSFFLVPSKIPVKKQQVVKRAYKNEIVWLKQAANMGYAAAQDKLGICYITGHGVTQNYRAAVKWFTRSMEQHFMASYFNLGLCYENGWGVPQNYNSAYKCFALVAEDGMAHAENKLGDYYYYGRGVEQNYRAAAKWYRRAADQGLAVAQCNLLLSGSGGLEFGNGDYCCSFDFCIDRQPSHGLQ